MTKGDYGKAIGTRFAAVRFRTYTLTAIMVIVLFLYYMVNVSTKNAISWIDFALICTVQLLSHFIYFPEGNNFGQKDPTFIARKDSYNEKAEKVNIEDKHESLRDFCEYDYEQRKKRYILTQCGYIGISLKELEDISLKTKKEIKTIEEYRYTENDKEKVVKFSRKKRKLLYNLIYKPIPVEKNHEETIVSAVERDGTEPIKDSSKSFAKWIHIKRFLMTCLVGAVMAYVYYTVRESFGLAECVAIAICLFSLFAIAVTSYNAGEQCSKVYKSKFYLELGNFLDEFFEWDKKYKEQK